MASFHQSLGSPQAMLYTDIRGNVVFVNRALLQILQLADKSLVIGQPLHRVLRTDRATAGRLLEARRAGERRQITLQMDHAPVPIILTCASEPAYDERDNFIGVNVMLDTQQAQVLSAAEPPDEAQELLAQYVTTQMNMLEVLLERMGGPRVRMAFEKVVNRAASRGGWPISLDDYDFTSERPVEPLSIYADLLRAGMAYAAIILNRQVVAREMRRVHEGSPSRQRELARLWGLYDVFEDT